MRISLLGAVSGTAVLVGMAGCGSSAAHPVAASLSQSPVVTSISLTPEIATVEAGRSFQFDVTARWSNGTSTPPAVTWSVVGGGHASAQGTYIAPLDADTVLVIATLSTGGPTDTAVVMVEAVHPDSTLPVDSTATGDTTVVGDTLSVGDTTTVVDSTGVPVDSTAAPPPPPDPLGPLPPPSATHEPTGYLPVIGRHFDALGTGNNGRGSGSLPWKSGGSEGFDDAESRYPNVKLATDSTAPLSPGGVLHFVYPPQVVPVGSTFNPGIVQTLPFTGASHGSRAYRKMYVRTAFRVSPNWQGHSTSTNKLVFFRSDGGSKRAEPILRLRGVGSGALVLNVDLQGSPRDVRNLANTSLNPNTAGANAAGAWSIQRGKWYVVEILLEAGQNGSADGMLRIWVNGVLTHEYMNIEYDPIPSVSNYWDTLHVSPNWGGTGGTISQTMWLEFDDFYVSGAP
jgi:hypothetical protein